jgi:signal transduction histidine kinase
MQKKMASLGQLTAGIAHEINNPINFVSSNIRPLRRDVDDLISILEKYDLLQEHFTADDIKSLMTNIKQFKEEIDYDYIRKEIEMLLKGMEEGASRTVEIVKGLKNFSRLDEAEIKHANINEGILSTLILLNNQLGDKVKIEKALGSLPDIECYPGKLNQVFMNLLNNSIYAIRNFKDGHGK